jgi:hypothetical protein
MADALLPEPLPCPAAGGVEWLPHADKASTPQLSTRVAITLIRKTMRVAYRLKYRRGARISARCACSLRLIRPSRPA